MGDKVYCEDCVWYEWRYSTGNEHMKYVHNCLESTCLEEVPENFVHSSHTIAGNCPRVRADERLCGPSGKFYSQRRI